MEITDLDAVIEADVAANKDVMTFGDRFAEKSVEWGIDDCSMWVATWIAGRFASTGREIVFPAYGSEAEARQIIDAAGGLANVWAEVAAVNGIQPVRDSIRAGDVGIINTFLHGDVGCIFMKYGAVAAIRSDPGYRMIGIREKHVVAAWRLP